jgi:hypothetical protein
MRICACNNAISCIDTSLAIFSASFLAVTWLSMNQFYKPLLADEFRLFFLFCYYEKAVSCSQIYLLLTDASHYA